MRQKSLDKRMQSEKRRLVRKEKSKEAARCRRGKEGEVFSDITDTLPVAESIKSALDKTSIIRLCINYIRTRELLSVIPTRDSGLMLPVEDVVGILHGFVIMLSPSAEVVYVTSNVKQLLGLCEFDVIGHSLDSFIHPADWEETEKHIKSKDSDSLGFTARFKSSLSSRSRGSNFKSSAYKPVRLSGQRVSTDIKPAEGVMTECLILTATPIEHPSLVNQPLDHMTFTSKHSLDMRFTECDEQASELTMYPNTYMHAKSLYDFVHPSDIKAVAAGFKSLSTQEHIQTNSYMFLTCGGGYVKIITQASIATDPKTNKPLHVLCVHSVISEVVGRGIVLADIQLCNGAAKVKTESVAEEYVCQRAKATQPSSAEQSAEGNYAFDDIYDTTASVFMDPADEVQQQPYDLDIMGATASIFDDIPLPEYGGTEGEDVLSGCGGEKNAFEELLEQLDKETIDMDKGVIADIGDADFKYRAPYIPMEDCNDIPLMSNLWCEPVSKTEPGWNSYRQGEGTTGTSPASSYSSSDGSSGSPVATSPWQVDNSSDLPADLDQFSYAQPDDDYGKAAEQARCSLADMNSSLAERISVANAEFNSPATSTDQTWSDGTFVLCNGVPKQAIYHMSNNCLPLDAPRGQQYGYMRRKRKADDHYSVASSMGQGNGTDTEPPFKTVPISSMQAVQNSQRQTQGLKQHTVAYEQQCVGTTTTSSSSNGSNQWPAWTTTAKRPNLHVQPTVTTQRDGRAKQSARIKVHIVSPFTDSGWLETFPHLSQGLKDKPTDQRTRSAERDRDELQDRNSILLDLLQQT